MATHSNILAQKIPWTEGPDGLQFYRVTKLEARMPSEEFGISPWRQ